MATPFTLVLMVNIMKKYTFLPGLLVYLFSNIDRFSKFDCF